LLFVVARGDGGKRAGWLVIFAPPHVHPAALLGKPDPAICPALDQYSPPATLGLAPDLQIHEIWRCCSVHRTRVALDGLSTGGSHTRRRRSRRCVPRCPLYRENLRGRVFILSCARRVVSLLQTEQEHEGARARAPPLCAICGAFGRFTRAFGSSLIAANPQSTVALPAAPTGRDNTSRAQVPGVDGARLPGPVLHRRLRTRRPAAVPCGGRTRAGQNNCLPNHRRGLPRARRPAGSRERRVACGSAPPPSAAALQHLWLLASGLARRLASGGARHTRPATRDKTPSSPARPSQVASPVCKRRVGPRRWPDEVRVWSKKLTACARQGPAA